MYNSSFDINLFFGNVSVYSKNQRKQKCILQSSTIIRIMFSLTFCNLRSRGLSFCIINKQIYIFSNLKSNLQLKNLKKSIKNKNQKCIWYFTFVNEVCHYNIHEILFLHTLYMVVKYFLLFFRHLKSGFFYPFREFIEDRKKDFFHTF